MAKFHYLRVNIQVVMSIEAEVNHRVEEGAKLVGTLWR